ncbi:MAG: hypothetical protein HYV15_05410 [Elusimicrobia bacterium]|nr:hypothetical protein [Elusimicrobiota bacterium]
MRRLPSAALVFALSLSGCSSMQIGGSKKKVVLKDFAEGRVVQVAITDRLTGAKEMLFVSMPKKSLFLEGYIQGLVVDYDDNPIQGVVVRAVAKGEQQFVDRGEAAFQTSSFDAGFSDSNGIYRIRFSLPILKNLVDIRGELSYNPGWEQERDNLGKAYRPQTERSPFRMFFDMKEGMLVFTEGVQKVTSASGKLKGRTLAGAQPAADEKPIEKPQGEEDLFTGFGFGP